jgi:hypothetical protein
MTPGGPWIRFGALAYAATVLGWVALMGEAKTGPGAGWNRPSTTRNPAASLIDLAVRQSVSPR